MKRIIILVLGQFPPRQLPTGSLLYCPRIITPWQLLPREVTITKYNFFMDIFCFFSMTQLYNFYYDTKNNNDSSNETWSLKLLSLIKLQHSQNGSNFSKQNNFLNRFGNTKITGNILIKLTSFSTLYLAFRIFDRMSHHSILGAPKNMFYER